MNNLNDTALARLLVNGNLEAFNIIYFRYFNAVYKNILKLLRNTNDANDILQEVFIALWEKRAGIDPDKSLAGWLFISSYHKCIDHIRKEHVVSQLSIVVQDEASAERDIAASEIEKDLQARLLGEAINILSPQKRKVFELCKLQGKTYEQTADELAISKHTVKEYLSAALVVIKNYIRQHPDYLTHQADILLVLCFSDIAAKYF